ncbi:hydratase [Desulfosporosinus sp. FKA]|uniref:hydratase n=1 Tax=Desulfosporosinus sp. FKA TaxID=1969834 RepID=UPI000B4A01BB|nr:hydratase [Desulfosporosinus sp. FKA]
MIRIINHGTYLLKGKDLLEKENAAIADRNLEPQSARKNTIAYKILSQHNTSGDNKTIKIRFDALASHDITYVGIIQTARASGLTKFPIPYALTNCHNSLCAVGGTINEDDHVFGLSAAQKYGGIYVPAHQAVIHQYVRETMTRCGTMILGSDSHTRYGALGTMGIGEGGPELVKQILEKTYDLTYPEIIAIYMKGKPRPGVGPQDIALAIIGAVFKRGFVKNKVLEFVGPGIENLSMDFRNGIDVMTTETACLSSIWTTDDKVKEYFAIHGRAESYAKLEPGEIAYYDGAIIVDLDKVVPMIALPFHPSNVYSIAELNQNLSDILRVVEEEGQKQIDNPSLQFNLTKNIDNGRLKVDQAIVAGCAGGSYENLVDVASIVENHSLGNDSLSLSVYPASQPIYLELVKNGTMAKLMTAGAIIKTAFCGPCFGAGDVPANGNLSIRHATRNFPNREGSKPGDGQLSSVALMDARSIAATAVNGGYLTPATDLDFAPANLPYSFDRKIYANRVYNGFSQPQPEKGLKFGPNIAEWPKMIALPKNLLLKVACVINDPVTTTDELIPSGETSSYRSNPLKLAEFTLSRKDPQYVERAKGVQKVELERQNYVSNDTSLLSPSLKELCAFLTSLPLEKAEEVLKETGIGTTIFAVKPGDGSAREQAASCQKVLGGWANIAAEYATKRYRSNLINWGILSFTLRNPDQIGFGVDDLIFIPNVKEKLMNGDEIFPVQVISPQGNRAIELMLTNLTKEEREIILSGCLINYYSK